MKHHFGWQPRTWHVTGCDEAEWFAILHGTGALVTRKWVSAQPGRSPLEAVNYQVPPLQTPLDYFGGNLGGGGYCVATKSLTNDGLGVCILEVLRYPAVLAWRDVTMEGVVDAHPTCKCLLRGSLVVSCYPEFLSNQKTGNVVIATRELRRLDAGWMLGASVEWAKVRCPQINQPFMHTHEVCAVATLQGSMTVYFSLASRIGNQGFHHLPGRPTIWKSCFVMTGPTLYFRNYCCARKIYEHHGVLIKAPTLR